MLQKHSYMDFLFTLNIFLDIDECLNDPCLHAGNCSNTDGSYSCNCVQQWTGQNCQIGEQSIVLFVFNDVLRYNVPL